MIVDLKGLHLLFHKTLLMRLVDLVPDLVMMELEASSSSNLICELILLIMTTTEASLTRLV